MQDFELYRDIAERTGGSVYIGVVGPARTGKSTVIKRIMEELVIPNIEDEYTRARAQDELPQSAGGRTIMTTQPRFVPGEPVPVRLTEGGSLSMRLVDCVGYTVPGALGLTEEGQARMVQTPWQDGEMTFEDAAEYGTRRVIREHSTVGLVVTTDGSITDIPRSAYIDAEERVVRELKQLQKPFLIILNSTHPADADTERLRSALEEKYVSPVICADARNMTRADIDTMLGRMLYEFPIADIEFTLTDWMRALPSDHRLIAPLIEKARAAGAMAGKMRDAPVISGVFADTENMLPPEAADMDLSNGRIRISLQPVQGLYYQVLSEECGVEIRGEDHLLGLLRDMASMRAEYERVRAAMQSVREKGYGTVAPTMDEMTLQEPELIRQGSRFGIRLKASAPSIHMMRIDVQTEVSPIVGTERQSEELAGYMMSEFQSDPAKIWGTNIFGKSLSELVREGISGKLQRMPEDAQSKLKDTVSKIVNEGNGGMICILL